MLEPAVEYGMVSSAEAAVVMLELVDDFWVWARHSAGSPEQRRRALERSEGLVTAAIPIVLHGAGAPEAIRVAETVRDCLLTARHAPRLPDNVAGAQADAYRVAAANYSAAQQRFRDGITDARDTALTAQELTDALTALRQLPGLGDFAKPPTIAELATLIEPDARAIYLIAAANGGTAVLLDSSGATSTVELPAMTEQAVVDQINEMLHSPDAVTDVAQWMWTNVAAPLLENVGTQQRWIVIPTGQTGMLPLHAAGTVADGWLDDLADVRALPRLSALADSPGPPAEGPAIVAISNTTDLPLLSADRAVALAYLDGATPVDTDNQGTVRDTVLEGLAEAPVAVLSGHARHSLSDGACIELDDGPLTADLVARLPRRDRDLAVVMACSSGQLATVLVNESIGLPNALLHAGFRGVCVSMWPIDDAPAFITLARLLQQHNTATPISARLRRVRHWLRQVTAQELRTWIEQLRGTVDIDAEDMEYLTEWLAPHGSSSTPLNDPVHWAGFTYVGA
jgi:CHAT domain-containing protein